MNIAHFLPSFKKGIVRTGREHALRPRGLRPQPVDISRVLAILGGGSVIIIGGKE